MDMCMRLNERDVNTLDQLSSSKYLETIFSDVLKSKGKNTNRSVRLTKFTNEIKTLGLKLLTMRKGIDAIHETIMATKLLMEHEGDIVLDEENRVQIFWESYQTNMLAQFDMYCDVMLQTLYNVSIDEENKLIKLENDHLKKVHAAMRTHIQRYKKYTNKEYVSLCERYAIQQLNEHKNILHTYKIELSYYDMHTSLANTLLEEHMNLYSVFKTDLLAINKVESVITWTSNMLIDEHRSYISKLNGKYGNLIDLYRIKAPAHSRGRARDISVIKIHTRWRSLSPNYLVLDE